MELRHLRYFNAVAEELNFRKASERLRISQPALSAQIRQLEEEIDARLFERDTHHVSLTDAGRRLLENSRRILRDVDDTTRTVKKIADGEEGVLSIGFVASLGHGLMPRLLRAYRLRFPNVELRLEEMDTTQQINAIEARRLDLGFIGLGLSAKIPNLKLATVVEERLVAVLPQGHPIAMHRGKKVKTLPLAALAGERFLLADRASSPVYNPWLMVLCQRAGFQPNIMQESGQPVTVLNYVAAGLGVTILPEQFSRLRTIGVNFIPLSPPVPRYRYCAAWVPENIRSSLRHFLSIAQNSV